MLLANVNISTQSLWFNVLETMIAIPVISGVEIKLKGFIYI